MNSAMTNSIIFVLLVLLVLALVAAGLFLYVYWWLMQRSDPKLNGQVKAPFLEKAVEIRRDKRGVPHIYAESQADLFRAQGWVHAQDRFWQMEQNRRTALGRLAEVFGEPALEADRFSRIVGFRRAAEAELPTLDAATRQVLEWYAEGVNAYMQSRPGRLAAELNLLRVRPEPWRALDTLAYAKTFGWALSLNWESELHARATAPGAGPVYRSRPGAELPR